MLTRAEAALLLDEYRGACADVSNNSRMARARAMLRRDAIRDRILNAMCGEEATRPLSDAPPRCNCGSVVEGGWHTVTCPIGQDDRRVR